MDDKYLKLSNNQGQVIATQTENNKVRILLEPGHGGEDTGDIIDGSFEKDANLDYAFRVGDQLNQQGFEVIYTRNTDVATSRLEKKQLAETSNADLYVSLHRPTNIGLVDQPGVEAIVMEPSEIELAAAGNLTRELEQIGFLNLGVIRSSSFSTENNDYSIPQVILLTGVFRDSKNVPAFDTNLDAIVDATVKGIVDTFNVQAQSMERRDIYMVQVSQYRTYEEALELQHFLLLNGYHSHVAKENEYYCVRCGEYEDLDKAVKVEQYFKRRRFNPRLLIKL